MTTRDLEPFKALLANPTESDLESLLELLMEENFAERGCLWLELENRFIYRGDEALRVEFPYSRQVVDQVLDRGRGFVSFDSSNDKRLSPSQSIAVNKVRSCLCSAARTAEGEVLAIAYFDNSATIGNFTVEDLEFLNEVMALFPGAARLSID